ncbi:coenzyme PQQ precursor peptide PqqA [Paraburkholderia sp. GAS32]|jgi:coenzyme PQQ precursor peptide PqqA
MQIPGLQKIDGEAYFPCRCHFPLRSGLRALHADSGIVSGMKLALSATAAFVKRLFIYAELKETCMQWTTPVYTDLRFGFEITMYIANR